MEPVFVDSSGRRGRRVRRVAWTVGAVCSVYTVSLVLSLTGATSIAPRTLLPLPGVPSTAPGHEEDEQAAPGADAPLPSAGPEAVVPGVVNAGVRRADYVRSEEAAAAGTGVLKSPPSPPASQGRMVQAAAQEAVRAVTPPLAGPPSGPMAPAPASVPPSSPASAPASEQAPAPASVSPSAEPAQTAPAAAEPPPSVQPASSDPGDAAPAPADTAPGATDGPQSQGSGQ